MSRVSLGILAVPGAITVGFILACGPLSSDDGLKPTKYGGGKTKGVPSSQNPTTIPSAYGDNGPLDDAAVDCDDNLSKPKAACSIKTIACGETIQGSNRGQGMHFGDDFYRAKYCTPRAESYEASPDAVYALKVPANMQADIKLLSPCMDLDLFSVRWGNAKRCPTASTSTGECEGSTKRSGDTIRIVSVGRDEDHLVWVDGKKGNIGNFELSVECRPAR